MTVLRFDNSTLGDIVARDYRAAAIFDRYGLDYCCGGKRSLAVACLERGTPLRIVLSELEALEPATAEVAGNDPVALADHIVARHHTYVRGALPSIQQHLAKILEKHGARHPELVLIDMRFATLAQELSLHMVKEEQVLFPHIRALAEAVRTEGPLPPDMFGTVQNPIRMMEIEHQEAGDGLAAIRELSGNYLPPDDACGTFRLVYRELEAFERDLRRHVHLENNVLFPKAVELESKAELMAHGLKSQTWN